MQCLCVTGLSDGFTTINIYPYCTAELYRVDMPTHDHAPGHRHRDSPGVSRGRAKRAIAMTHVMHEPAEMCHIMWEQKGIKGRDGSPPATALYSRTLSEQACGSSSQKRSRE